MARRRVHRLGHPCSRTVALAIVGSAEVRAAFHDFARDLDLRLARVVAGLAVSLRNITAATSLSRGMICGIPVSRPLPHVSDHVVNTITIRRKLPHRSDALIPVFAQVLPRELALPGVSHMSPAG